MIYFVYQCSKRYEKEEGKGEKREERRKRGQKAEESEVFEWWLAVEEEKKN